MTDTKPWYLSRTVWASAISVALSRMQHASATCRLASAAFPRRAAMRASAWARRKSQRLLGCVRGSGSMFPSSVPRR